MAIQALNETDKGKNDDWKRRSVHKWLRIGDLKTVPHSQRPFLPHWAEELLDGFALENMGVLVVSKHGHEYLLIDGQHRVWVLRRLGFSDDDTVLCEVYEGLNEKQEAELFLIKNHFKTVAALAKYSVAVHAERRTETEIDNTVHAQGLKIGNRVDGGISAVGALAKVHRRVGIIGLGTVLRIIRDAYGLLGFQAVVVEGLGLFVQRYQLTGDEARTIQALSTAPGGLNGLLNETARIRTQVGLPKAVCLAAAVTVFYNRTPGKKLPSWWKE